jgi:hypothetical protein
MERRDLSPRPVANACPTVPPARQAPTHPACSDPRIEDYLDQVSAPLIGWVPYAARMELRAELQAHLESLVAAYQELGSNPDAAVREALAQSGDPQIVASDWVREWGRILRPRKAPSIWHSTRVALGSFGLATGLGLAFLTVATRRPYSGEVADALFTSLLAVVLPMLAGLMTGLLSPTRAARGTAYALALLIPPTTLALPWLFEHTSYSQALLTGWFQSCSWIPIGCGAASLGSWLLMRHEEMQRRGALPARS